jgi:excisionase family DNA binding protein
MDEILTIKGAAAALNVSMNQVRHWVRHSRLPAFKVGKQWRIKRCDLAIPKPLRTGPKKK